MIIAVDTGGTKTLVASFGKDGVIIEQSKFETPKEPKEYIKTLKETLIEKYHNKPVEIVVIATPGIIKNGVIIWGGGNLLWNNINIVPELHGVLGKAPIFLENDANLAGLGETRFLKVTPPQSLYVTISTGIGTGIITDGHINLALRNGEAGHSLIEYDGVVQEWEKFASGKAIYNIYGNISNNKNCKFTCLLVLLALIVF